LSQKAAPVADFRNGKWSNEGGHWVSSGGKDFTREGSNLENDETDHPGYDDRGGLCSF
jgi:hypothetical protein